MGEKLYTCIHVLVLIMWLWWKRNVADAFYFYSVIIIAHLSSFCYVCVTFLVHTDYFNANSKISMISTIYKHIAAPYEDKRFAGWKKCRHAISIRSQPTTLMTIKAFSLDNNQACRFVDFNSGSQSFGQLTK